MRAAAMRVEWGATRVAQESMAASAAAAARAKAAAARAKAEAAAVLPQEDMAVTRAAGVARAAAVPGKLGLSRRCRRR